MYLWDYRGKFGGCWQILTQKKVSGSKLCCRDRGIWAKCDDIWLSGQDVANMLAWWSDWTVQLWGVLLRGCSSCSGFVSVGRGSTLICIPLASESLRMRVRLCFRGSLSGVSGDRLFDVDVTTPLPLQSLLALRNSFALLSIWKWAVASPGVVPWVGEYLSG